MVPDHFKWVIIKHRNYDHMRTYEGYNGFDNIDQTEDDAVKVRASILEMGGREEDIL